jgi:hypothetical protein
MWSEAAKWLAGFPEAVVTIVDVDGYPVSVRQYAWRYDAATGELLVQIPETLRAAQGPANVLCHYHDEKLWNLRAIQIKGRLEQRCGEWAFVSTAFTPPASGQLRSLWQLGKRMRTSANNYLRRRGLERPQVDWMALKTLQRRAREFASDESVYGSKPVR